jgi:hypothetical protein
MFVGMIVCLLLWHHYVADFMLQSHWMATNKSKRLDALLLHVGIYTFYLIVAMTLLTWSNPLAFPVLSYALLNGALHFCIDFVTSKLSAFAWQEEEWHGFFLIVGFDQFLHTACLILTFFWFLGI